MQRIRQGVREWLETHEYSSVRQMRGSMSQQKVADPSAFERALTDGVHRFEGTINQYTGDGVMEGPSGRLPLPLDRVQTVQT